MSDLKPHQTCYNCDGKGAHNEGCPALEYEARRTTSPSPASEARELPPVLAWAVESNIGGTRAITKLTTIEEEADRYANASQAEYAGCERRKIELCARAASTRTASDTRTAGGAGVLTLGEEPTPCARLDNGSCGCTAYCCNYFKRKGA